ncbi:hypothetical protein NIES4074_55090 [Cylindrospermum sp. NIES-4074]|nr:hypothetical protein NIES4074_55090 [Cylindrospermum sp. NIES-4074]
MVSMCLSLNSVRLAANKVGRESGTKPARAMACLPAGGVRPCRAGGVRLDNLPEVFLRSNTPLVFNQQGKRL